MSENRELHDGGPEHGDHQDDHGHHEINYFLIYVVLVVLFLISVAGPEVGEFTGLRWITLVTAFGIAVVKANLVIQNFMHLKWEKNIMKWMLATSLILMFLMVAGISPDVMNHEGRNWENVAAKESVERGVEGEAGAEEAAPAVASVGFSAETAFQSVCASCHGTGGVGDGPASGGLEPPPANFTTAEFWATRDRDRIMTVIENGAASVGGSSLMAAYGPLYSDEQINALADYVMAFQPGGAPAGAEVEGSADTVATDEPVDTIGAGS